MAAIDNDYRAVGGSTRLSASHASPTRRRALSDIPPDGIVIGLGYASGNLMPDLGSLHSRPY